MRRTNTEPKICLHCSQTFNRGRLLSGRIESLEDWTTKKYCSHICFELAHKGQNHQRYVDGIRRGHNWGYLRVSDGRFIHRIVMEQKLGRTLCRHEHVHHIDGNVLNNDPDNLQLMDNSSHRKLHAAEQTRNTLGMFTKAST